MTGHTPGPWRVVDGAPDTDASRRIMADGPYAVARVSMLARFGDNDTRSQERDANARLIAAAPELLALAQEFVADFAPNTAELAGWRAHFRAALAKVEG